MAGDVFAVGAEMTWASKGRTMLQGKVILAEMSFEVEPENYFEEVMIWDVGIVHVESLHLMWQTVAVVAGAADIAVVAVAFLLPIELHRLVAVNL